MTGVTADRSSLGRRELLRTSVRNRVSSLVLIGATWVMAAVSIAVNGARHLLLLVVAPVVIGAAVL